VVEKGMLQKDVLEYKSVIDEKKTLVLNLMSEVVQLKEANKAMNEKVILFQSSGERNLVLEKRVRELEGELKALEGVIDTI
jgi:hypothetical protein